MASGTAKVFWVIWRQQGERVVGRSEQPWKMHSDCYQAVSASFALAQWCRASYINAEVLAVLRGDFAARWAGGLGDSIAEHGTRGAADAENRTRQPLEWMTRAELAEYLRCPAAGVEKKDLEALEADIASCCALRLSGNGGAR